MQRSLGLATIIASLVLVFAPAAAQAASADGYNKFSFPRSYETAVDWYESHRGGVLEASNCRILKNLGGGQYQCQTSTPLGACVFVLKETRQDTTDKDGRPATIYRFTFVRNISGRVTNQKVTIKLSQTGQNTTLQMWMSTSVAGRFVPVFAVSRVQQGCLAGCESYGSSG
ncbi:MAG: hypothetical protein RIC55_26905 [Pirellulaceae bacterium]